MTDAHDKRKKQEQAHAERIAQYKKDLKEHQDSLKQQRDYTLKIATTSNATALENERLKKENERLKALYAHDKAIADQMRRLPVKDVLQRFLHQQRLHNKPPDQSHRHGKSRRRSLVYRRTRERRSRCHEPTNGNLKR